MKTLCLFFMSHSDLALASEACQTHSLAFVREIRGLLYLAAIEYTPHHVTGMLHVSGLSGCVHAEKWMFRKNNLVFVERGDSATNKHEHVRAVSTVL